MNTATINKRGFPPESGKPILLYSGRQQGTLSSSEKVGTQVSILNESMQGNPEAEVCSIEIGKVILPNGNVKNNVIFNTENTIMEEKENILREAQIPYPILYVMVIHGPNNSREVLDDSKYVEAYLEIIGEGAGREIYIQKKSSQVERAPRPVNTELFNINLKP